MNYKNTKLKILTISFFILLSFFCLAKISLAMVFPGTDWQTATPANQGVDSNMLNQALEYFRANSGGAGTDEMVIIRNGYIIWQGPAVNNRHTLHSGTKTFTTTVLGLLLKEGKISSINDQAVNYYPALDDTYSTYSGITFKHFASFTSGYQGQGTAAITDMPWGDPRQYLTPAAPLASPGQKWQYNDPAIHQLGNILKIVSGETLENIFKTRIADRIGMTNWEWQHLGYKDNGASGQVVAYFLNPSGVYGGGIHAAPLDIARYGLLYLNRGNWNGQQLLPTSWVDEATTNQVPTSLAVGPFDLRGKFGYMWWTNGIGTNGLRPWPSAPPKTYTFHGGSRNFNFVIPEWNMVIVRMTPPDTTSMSNYDSVWEGFFSRLAPGVSPIVTPPAVSGTMKVWQPLTISFTGPSANESDINPNPFLDYRLQATLTSPSGKVHNISGFFDGDGNGNGSGNIWKVKFTPDEPGNWNFKASFRQGENIAVSLDSNAGFPVHFDGQAGTFSVGDRDAGAPGFLGKGRLSYVEKQYLKTLGDGEYWIKGGADEPENFLAYAGFDNTSAGPKIIHTYSGHISDWQPGDPDWGDGKGKGIIGSLNYLSAKNVNSIYFLVMNIGGDGQDVWPYSGAINRAGSTNNDNLHFDISKLIQWNTVFEHANKKGINLHVVLNEAEINNKQELDNATLGNERKLYYREMAARFGYLNGLVWNLCEEYDHGDLAISASMIKSWAGYLKSVDGHNHPVGVHNVATDAWIPFFGDSRLDFVSYQYYQDPPYEVDARNSHYGDRVEELNSSGVQAGKMIPVGMDEFWLAKRADDESHEEYTPVWPNNWPFASGNKFLRKNVTWPVYFSGGQLEYIMEDKLETEDFRPYAKLWDYTWFARKFMLENIPFWEMSPADSLLTGEAKGYQEDGQVLAKAGEIYAIYLPNASATGSLDLRGANGSFQKSWYNPRTGQFAGGNVTVSGGSNILIGTPPSEATEDWVVLFKKNTSDTTPPAAPTGMSVQ